ncbi:MAG: energy transducer TonB [Bacteroidetes bacterium]|nr:energy transducer TonB [Bacteroidota bacterium]
MKILLTSFFALLLQFSFAQKEDQLIVCDQDWKPTKIKKAIYLLRVRQPDDSTYERTYYKIYGPRIKQESFKDEKSTIRNGKFSYYYSDGILDSTGRYINNEQSGTWYYNDHKGHVIREKNYVHGVVVKDTAYSQHWTEPNQKIELKPGEKESEFPGGAAEWNRYLGKNLHYPDRAVNNEVMGEVRIQFIVDKEGNVIDPEINKSVEYSLDEESLRMIKGADKWEPAMQEGRKVKSYKIQPIKFMLTKG